LTEEALENLMKMNEMGVRVLQMSYEKDISVADQNVIQDGYKAV